jgi:hypothetical protein
MEPRYTQHKTHTVYIEPAHAASWQVCTFVVVSRAQPRLDLLTNLPHQICRGDDRENWVYTVARKRVVLLECYIP